MCIENHQLGINILRCIFSYIGGQMKYLIVFVCLVFILLIYSLCKIAGESDEKIERMIRNSEIKKNKEEKPDRIK